ncbi:16S rRNA (guanine(966)-N(2))-methyltransferase RsmD [Naasia sp. SYSU D00948]|uniref:16S rRNA (guanine(966)-N(2))-methyltransferase RsmD n=1 Tax=Naasia sp. SYSU D00948 TaxID=2817379 RepID=UPI001B30569E|nr:16S rRNA (guanine(966)-N(2))-methyltransferase RsmD [Naasia sp. SYSU D00948]
MARIISGAAGSLRLRVPRSGTRPTSDRVREGIFSSLTAEGAIEEARVLDLYAGSGALGLEAMSRGASSAVLVDRSPDAVAVCRANAQLVARSLGTAAGAIEVVRQSASTFLASAAGPFDLAFLDPPYDLGDAELAATLAALAPLLAPDAVVVVERSLRSGEPRWPEGIEPVRTRRYGETAVHLARAT